MRSLLSSIGLVLSLAVTGCDGYSFWQSENYEVYAIGQSQHREFGVNLGGGGIQGLVDWKVVGIGENDRWIVVERYPYGDKTRPEFYYLEKLAVIHQRNGNDVVHGPFSQAEITQKRVELKLPPISERFD